MLTNRINADKCLSTLDRHTSIWGCYSTQRSDRYGFTLIELSIVLVVIGLLVGGVLLGKDLIKGAEIRAVVGQLTEYSTAVNTFKLKYASLPGDMPPSQASQLGFFTFTGSSAGSYAIYAGIWRAEFGDNNGNISNIWSANGGFGEGLVFWQHLSEAKLIRGQYGGAVSSANYLQPDTTTLTNGGSPASPPSIEQNFIFWPTVKLTNGVNWLEVYGNRTRTDAVMFNTNLSNMFFFLSTPYEAFSVDSKLDDGVPDKGRVRDDTTSYNSLGVAPCTKITTPNAYDLNPSTMNIVSSSNCGVDYLW